jgi:hypothetical protein
MKGFIYRLGTTIKEVGERIKRVPLIGRLSGGVINTGLWIRDLV